MKAKKWTGTEMAKRRRRAQRLREYRRAESPAKRKIGELAIAREVVAAEVLQDEAVLSRTRWVTYAYMSAMACTELFCKLYLDAYRNHYAKVRDYLTAGSRIPVDHELLQNDNRQISSFWRARQRADQLGIPYEVFLEATMAWATNQKDRKQLPAPNQLYSAKALKAAQELWEQTRDTVSLFSDDWDPRLFVGDEKTSLARAQAVQLLIRRVSKSKNPEITLASYLGRGAVDETLARRLFGGCPGLVDEALRRLSDPAPESSADSSAPYVPGCFGLTSDSSAAACSGCPLARQCRNLWTLTTAELVHATGDADPLAWLKREQATKRKQRQRARERAAALAA